MSGKVATCLLSIVVIQIGAAALNAAGEALQCVLGESVAEYNRAEKERQ